MQLMKLTRVEKSQTTSKLFFLTGSRSINALDVSIDVARNLTAALSCAPDLFADQVKALQAGAKATNKTLSNALKALAEADASKLLEKIKSGEKVVALHRDEVGLNFLSEVADLVAEDVKAASSSYLLFASSSDAVGGAAGAVLLVVDTAKVTEWATHLPVDVASTFAGICSQQKLVLRRRTWSQGRNASAQDRHRALACCCHSAHVVESTVAAERNATPFGLIALAQRQH
jgi:alanyl-tRNA synthetase